MFTFQDQEWYIKSLHLDGEFTMVNLKATTNGKWTGGASVWLVGDWEDEDDIYDCILEGICHPSPESLGNTYGYIGDVDFNGVEDI
jgi:hypothetical protein